MSDEPHVEEHDEQHEDEADAGYAPPPEKSLDELMALDTEDESLRKYKATLLGQATGGEVVVVGEFILVIFFCNHADKLWGFVV